MNDKYKALLLYGVHTLLPDWGQGLPRDCVARWGGIGQLETGRLPLQLSPFTPHCRRAWIIYFSVNFNRLTSLPGLASRRSFSHPAPISS